MTYQNQTCLILGAGASKEIGLPVGEELKEKIASLLNIQYEHGMTLKSGSYEIDNAFRIRAQQRHNLNINPFLHACWTIRDGMPQAISIDNYLDAHAGNEEIELSGKLGIAKSILDAERHSQLFVDPNTNPRMIDFGRVKNSWFNKFFQLLTENCQVNDIVERLSKIKVISFNYDRCLEHYLFFALQNYFRINEHNSMDLLKYLKIYHPYGKVGKLPWQNEEGPSIAFGANANGQQLLDIATDIRTFTQGTNPETSNIEELRKCLVESNRLVFLGFAYHRINIELMRSNQNKPAPNSVYGTAFGISRSDTDLIESDISKLVGKTIRNVEIRNDLTCVNLFDEYWRTLSMT